MALKCIDCGQIFNDDLKECPNCGCPSNVCEHIEENHSEEPRNEKNEQPNKNSYEPIHETFNEKPHYFPNHFILNFLLKDPKVLTRYPIGELEKRHPFWGWVFGPIHLTCKDESAKEQYDVINNIFYALNLLGKAAVYAFLWLFFKAWIAVLIMYGSYFLSVLIISSVGIIGIVCALPFVIIAILSSAWITLEEFIAIVKSIHRYWPQFNKVCRRLCKRFVCAMKN